MPGIQDRLSTSAGLALIAITAPLWLTLVVLVGVACVIRSAALYALVWIWWMGRARHRVLFVYSDSPNWKEHIERQILPRLPRNAVILNWSRRQELPGFSLPRMLFRGFAGDREFNPIALVFKRFGLVERYRFWKPFREAKRGKGESLRKLEAALFDRLEMSGKR